MIEYSIEDEFETTVDAYWEMFFSDEYNAELWPHIDVEYERLEFRREGEGDGQVIHRRQRLTPKREVPRALKRIVKDAISYEEQNVWRRAQSSMSVVTVPNFMSSKFDAKGTYAIEPRGEGKVARIWKAHVSCSVPLVGGTVESSVVDQVKESYRRTTEFTRQWIAARK